MNKAVTDGVDLMPPPFAQGLNVWSSGDGTPGSDTYQGAANAVLVAADQDFGGCLELVKTDTVQRLRYMGETPLLPGCYLQIRVRLKVLSGNLPSVRVAAWAGGAGGAQVPGVPETGQSVALTTYGEVVEVSAIVGTGARNGVDMPWGIEALYGHFGIDLTGASGGIVRIDDIEIADVTSYFLRDMVGLVDVLDYGAIGDGITDNTPAFQAANDAASGRRVVVPEGNFRLNDSITFDVPVTFEGTLSMPNDKMLILTKDFNLPNYIAAFGDEELGFRKAFQALLNNADHDSLDMGGRRVTVNGPIDMQAAVPNKTSYATRRVIRNGQLTAASNAAWDTDTVTSQATYDPSDSRTLSSVGNVANIPVGALVEGSGVGREIYVAAKNVGAGEITLSSALYNAAGTQTYTFRDFKYMLDFSGFQQLSKFELSEMELRCSGYCSGIRLAPSGSTFAISGSIVNRPRDRGITSIDSGCQGMLIDRCQFLSYEDALNVEDRVSIALNVNSNDVKLRSNRATRFRHFAVMGGDNHMIVANHFFQGDSVANGVRSAGIVLADNYCSSTLSANYIDNCFVEWTNERDSEPDYVSGFSFASLSFTDNICLCGDTADWFSYLVVKPFGTGHYLNGVTITGNKFRSINGTIDRAERVDTSFAPLDHSRNKNVTMTGNTYHQVSAQVTNPRRVRQVEATATKTWVVDLGDEMPFEAQARRVDAVVSEGAIKNGSGNTIYTTPFIRTLQGSKNNKVDLVWEEAVSGEVALIVRLDE